MTDRDAHLDRILVGGREPAAIVIVDYDAAWPRRFEIERDRIATALRERALAIHHMGSTAVPGLAAKPIVDVLLVVEDVGDDAIIAALVAAGYELRVREPGHRMVRTPARDVHVHLWSAASPEIARHLSFRDRLRASDADRDAYAALKRELAGREWADINDYADAKSGLIAEIQRRARSEPRPVGRGRAPIGPVTRQLFRENGCLAPRLMQVPSGRLTHNVARAAEKVPGLRRVPVVRLLSAAEVAVLARDHIQRLSPTERRRLLHLMRVGRGRRARLTDREHDELDALVAKLDPRRLAGDTVDRLSPVPLPKRLLYGKRA